MSERRRQRSKKKKKVKFKGIDLNTVKAKLATLQQGNRLREAIVYAYYNYLTEVQGYFNVARRPSQTAREFAMDLVKKVKLPTKEVYTFTTIYEEARFGRHEMNPQKYTDALQLFMSLHELIMGKGGQVQVVPAPASSLRQGGFQSTRAKKTTTPALKEKGKETTADAREKSPFT